MIKEGNGSVCTWNVDTVGDSEIKFAKAVVIGTDSGLKLASDDSLIEDVILGVGLIIGESTMEVILSDGNFMVFAMILEPAISDKYLDIMVEVTVLDGAAINSDMEVEPAAVVGDIRNGWTVLLVLVNMVFIVKEILSIDFILSICVAEPDMILVCVPVTAVV